MIVVRAARPEDLPGLTVVMAQAFNVKMRVLFGRDSQRTQRLLQVIYAGPVARGYDGIVIAELDGAIVGGLVIEPMPWSANDARRLETALVSELSAWRQFWNKVGFSVFDHGPEPGDAYISDVCVRHDQRGRGIAQQMMAYSENWARAHGRLALTLWVAAGNRNARRVYEKAGLRVAGSDMGLVSGLLYGVFRWTYMKKALV